MSQKVTAIAVAAAVLAVAGLSYVVYENKTKITPHVERQAPPTEQRRVEQRTVEPAQPVTSPPIRAALHFFQFYAQTDEAMPEACLRFSQPLTVRDVNLADYLTIEPEVKPAIRVTQDRLCLVIGPH